MSNFDSPQFKRNFQTNPNQKPLRQFTVGAPEDMPQQQMQPLPVQQQSPLSPAEQQFFNSLPPTQSPQQAHQPQQLTVDEARAQSKAVKEAREAANFRLNEGAKTRIEVLTGIGRLTKDVEIGGVVFSLRTLKAREKKEASLATFSQALTNLEASFEARKQQLARSLFKIDGHDIAIVLGDGSLEHVLSWLEDLEDVVVVKLWDEFQALKTEAETKYGVSSVKEAEEVATDLKK